MQIFLSENADTEPRLQELNSLDLQTASLVGDRMFSAREDAGGTE